MLSIPKQSVQSTFLLSCFFDLGFNIFPLHKFRRSLSGSAWRCDCKQGWKCNTPGKHPKIRWTDQGQYPDAGGIKLYLAEGFTGWGVHLGLSGLAAVDLDPVNGGRKTMDAIDGKWGGFPETFCTITGSGGKHWYFHTHGSTDPIKGFVGHYGHSATSVSLGPGVDTFAGQHFLVLPYSPHKSGVFYKHNGIMTLAALEDKDHGQQKRMG